MLGLAALAGVDTTMCDMCAYGMVAEDKDGVAPAKKRTRLMSNAPEVLKRTGRQCSNKESGAALDFPLTRRWPKLQRPKEEHRHVSLLSGKARQCQVYPREFCRAVCEGVAAQKKLSRMGLRVEALMTLEEMLAVVPEDMDSGDPGKDLHECEADDYTLADGIMAFDDQSGARLKPELMRRVRRDEIAYFKEMEVYEKVPIEECWKETGK